MISGFKTILTRKMFMQYVLNLLQNSTCKRFFLIWMLTAFGIMYFIGVDFSYKPIMLYVYQRDIFGQVVDKKCEFKSLIYYQIVVRNSTYNGSEYQSDLCTKVEKGTALKVFYSNADPNIMTLRDPYKGLVESCSFLVCVLLFVPTLLTKLICDFIDGRKF